MYEEELSEKYPFHNKQMTELGYENYSDRKFKEELIYRRTMHYPDQDLFGTKEEALDKAKVIGCYLDEESFHQMDRDSKLSFMPCKTHTEYDGLLVRGQKFI